MNVPKERKSRLFVVWVCVSGFLAVVLAVAFFGFFSNPKFDENVLIGGVDVSNMVPFQAAKKVEKSLRENPTTMVFESGESKFSFSTDDFEFSNKAFATFSKDAIKKQTEKNATLTTGVVFPSAAEKIQKRVEEIECEPVEAEVVFNKNLNEFSVTPEKCGVIVDRERLAEMVFSAVLEKDEMIFEIPTICVPCATSIESLEENLQKRSSFTTEFDSSVSGRGKNIALALSAISGKTIQPGEEFSFLNAVGEVSKNAGYQEAKIIKNGKFVDSIGGGICQASTTVFNAALLAGLEIVESHPHSLQVFYVRPSFDAMVSQTADMRFKNNLSHPIHIIGKTVGNEATVEIWGSPLESGEKFERVSETIRTIPCSEDEIMIDVGGDFSKYVTYRGEFHRIKPGKDGLEARSVLKTWKNGKLENEKVLRTDRYQPQKGILVEGADENIPSFFVFGR